MAQIDNGVLTLDQAEIDELVDSIASDSGEYVEQNVGERLDELAQEAERAQGAEDSYIIDTKVGEAIASAIAKNYRRCEECQHLYNLSMEDSGKDSVCHDCATNYGHSKESDENDVGSTL